MMGTRSLGLVAVGALLLVMIGRQTGSSYTGPMELDAWLPAAGGGDDGYEESMTAGVLAGPTRELRLAASGYGGDEGSESRGRMLATPARTSSLADAGPLSTRARDLGQTVRQLDNEGKLARTKAHLSRLEAGDEIRAASVELRQAARDEAARGHILQSVKGARAGFKQSAAEMRRYAAESKKLAAKAGSIRAKVTRLRGRTAAYAKLAKEDKKASTDARNRADQERKLVADGVVAVSNNAKRDDDIKRRIAKIRMSFLVAKKKGEAEISSAEQQGQVQEARAAAADEAFHALKAHATG